MRALPLQYDNAVLSETWREIHIKSAPHAGRCSMLRLTHRSLPADTLQLFVGPSPRMALGFHIANRAQRELPEPFFAKFLQPVFLEGNAVSEEAMLAAPLFTVFIANCGQLDAANIVRHLKQSIGFGRCVFVDDGVLGNRFLNRRMYRIPHDFLAVIVIDFNEVILLEKCKIISKEDSQISLHSVSKFDGVGVLAFLENERFVLDGAFFGKNAKSCEEALPLADGVCGILVVATQDRCEVERRVWEPCISERFGEVGNVAGDIVILVVEDKCQQIELGSRTDIARFIDKDRQLTHQKTSINKNAGGNPPALGQPSIAERWLVYTTGRGVLSSRNYSKHMFDS